VRNMPQRYYAFQYFDATKHVRAAIREKTISHKHAREIATAMKGLSLEKARDYLLDVTNFKRSIPFGRYKNKWGIDLTLEQCRVDIHKKLQQKF